MKIIQNTLKIEEKFSDVPIFFRVSPKKVGLVGFPETRHFFSLIVNESGTSNHALKGPCHKVILN